MNWFKQCSTVEDVKKLYRTLAMQHHPDRPGGDTETMQQVNAAYHAILQDLDGQFCKADNEDKGFTYRYNEDREQAVMDKVSEVIRSRVLDRGVDCYIIGSWLWIIGETKPLRTELGRDGLGFIWHSQRKAWYWRQATNKRRYNSKSDLAGIAARYGAEKVINQPTRENELQPA